MWVKKNLGEMKPKEFISWTLIQEIRDVVFQHPYLSFLLMSVGIEFLGKCRFTKKQSWQEITPSEGYSEGEKLMSEVDPRYAQINLQKQLRNGIAHAFLPKSQIALSEAKHGAIHFSKTSQGQIILVAEIFYRDFVIACKKVLETEFPTNDKVNLDFMYTGPSMVVGML